MKILILLASLITTQAFASFNICEFEETWQLTEAMEKLGKKTSTSKNHKKFTSTEKDLILESLTTQGEDLTRAQALIQFGDYFGDRTEPGSNAGEIEYYTVGSQKFIIVHFWPGDNEYGAIFEVKNGKNINIANIGDSFIECI
jgi:hypothetical protein